MFASSRFWTALAFALVVSCIVPVLSHAAPADAKSAPVELRVAAFNILVDLEKPFDPRKEQIVKLLRDAKPDILGIEEMTPNQYAYMTAQLSEYGHTGEVPLTPEDIDLIAKRLPVVKAIGLKTYTDVILFYRNDTFEKLDEGHWWLSSTPDKVSNDFGNAFPRIAVWAKLRHKATGREIIAVNTHFDNSLPSQTKMATLSHDLMKPLMDQGLPMLFFGDFNTDQKRGDYNKLVSDGWRDSYTASPKASPNGRDENVITAINRTRIDHIFYFGDALTPKEWTRLEFPDPQQPLSDHYPIFARFEWK
jgi:endonuclease/exonuclease/phosphatase family metal-dependent hydrolase